MSIKPEKEKTTVPPLYQHCLRVQPGLPVFMISAPCCYSYVDAPSPFCCPSKLSKTRRVRKSPLFLPQNLGFRLCSLELILSSISFNLVAFFQSE